VIVVGGCQSNVSGDRSGQCERDSNSWLDVCLLLLQCQGMADVAEKSEILLKLEEEKGAHCP